MKKMLGKIEEVTVGYGGYQDAQLGVSFKIGGSGWGTHDFWGFWGMGASEHANWSRDDQVNRLGEVFLRIRDLLNAAQVQHVQQLQGMPNEVTFEGSMLQSWRILTEVL